MAERCGLEIEKLGRGPSSWVVQPMGYDWLDADWDDDDPDVLYGTLGQIEKWLLDRDPLCADPDPHLLRAALEGTGLPLNQVTVLSPQVDPFRLDTPANHQDGRWVADLMTTLGVTTAHIRGLHYEALTRPKPNGEPYGTGDWEWMLSATKSARWLGYIPFDAIEDHKNDDPVIRVRPLQEPLGYARTDFEVETPTDLDPTIYLDDFNGVQPYRIALLGEKSSLEPVCGPLSERYGTDMLLFGGTSSETRIFELAKAAAEDGRELIVLYLSDSDPSGWNMPIEVAAKLQAFKAQLFPWLEFRCYRVGLTPDQVKNYNREHPNDILPESPVREAGKRAADWVEAKGVQQI